MAAILSGYMVRRRIINVSRAAPGPHARLPCCDAGTESTTRLAYPDRRQMTREVSQSKKPLCLDQVKSKILPQQIKIGMVKIKPNTWST